MTDLADAAAADGSDDDGSDDDDDDDSPTAQVGRERARVRE